MKRIAFVVLVTLSISVLGAHTSPVHAEDMKRWQLVDPDGKKVAGFIVEGLPSFYSTYITYFTPESQYYELCKRGCSFVLDSYQNVEGTTSTSSTSTTTTISGGSNSGTTTTSTQVSASTTSTLAPQSGSGVLTGWTLRIAQLSTNQMQINGCIDYSGSATPKVFDIAASWTISSGGAQSASGSGNSRGLNLQTSGTTCPTEFLANVSGLSPSTEYLVSYTGGISGNIVTGSRTVVTSNAPPTTTTTTSTTSPSSITIEPTTTSSSLSSSSSSNVNSSTTTTAVPSGEVRASVGGVEVEAKTTVGKNAVSVSVGEVKAEISNKGATDNSTNTDTQQGLVLSSGESADVSIDGLQPNSEVEVVIYSTPRNLGSLEVNEFGELVASIEIPSNMESGSHTLVLKGLDKFGKQIELKFGLVVYSPDAYIPVWVWFLIGLLFILLALSFVSRRSKKGVITN